MNYSIYLINNDRSVFDEMQECLKPDTLQYFDGNGYSSFSQLVNSCVASSPTETVIIANYKSRPTPEHVHKTLRLLNEGYAFVGLGKFKFFGLKKELFRKIGMFDERYVGGGHEDYDFIVRLIENDLALYMTEEVPIHHATSKWANPDGVYPGHGHWATKWKHYWTKGAMLPDKLERTMNEEKYDYDLGPSVPTKFLNCRENSYTEGNHCSEFFYMPLASIVGDGLANLRT
jgi:hypothetical protein